MKKVFMVLVVLVCMLYSGCKEKNEVIKYDTEDDWESVELIEVGKEKNACIVSSKSLTGDDIIPGKYLVLSSVAGETEEIKTGYINHYSRYDINLYDLKSGELVKKIDVNELMEQEKEYQITSNVSYRTVEVEGKECIRFVLERIPDEEDNRWNTDCKYLYVNIDTLDTFTMTGEEDDVKVTKNSDIEREMSIFDEWGEYSLKDANGFSSQEEKEGKEKYFYVSEYPCWEGVVQVWMTTDYLPKENQALYSEFPKLKEYQGKEGMVAYIYLSDYPSAEEIFKLFMEEGQEVSFEGVVLDAELSIDGQGHEIHSFEEYYQWRK